MNTIFMLLSIAGMIILACRWINFRLQQRYMDLLQQIRQEHKAWQDIHLSQNESLNQILNVLQIQEEALSIYGNNNEAFHVIQMSAVQFHLIEVKDKLIATEQYEAARAVSNLLSQLQTIILDYKNETAD